MALETYKGMTLVQMKILANQQRVELERARQGLAFACSVIKSGEPWTDTCEKIIGAAMRGEL